MVGKTIAHYKVGEKIGAGGMGEVYQATDTKLNREVALKVLPETFAKDAERMARFKREAQVLASLNHPNIAAIYGLEQEGDTQAIAMELVEGPTLGDRIKEGALPLDEALNISKQIAEALESAHEQGVIHRDLKPANVKVTDQGTVKVLDFGLAKALEDPNPEEDIGNSPTISIAATKAGVILGTAAYMSPEQARGHKADRRADIWSFGVVLYEMLTGRRAFDGETVSDVLAAVLRAELDWDSLPPQTPPAIRRLLERCLTKDKRRRLGAISEATFTIDEYHADPSASSFAIPSASASAGTSLWQRTSPWLAAVLSGALIVSLIGLWRAAPPPEMPVIRFSQAPPADSRLDVGVYPSVAMAPDGSAIVYVVRQGGTRQLYLRRFSEPEAVALAGTEGAANPFFSPGGDWVGFLAEGNLKKVPVGGGPVVTLASVALNSRGASWGNDGFIVYSPQATDSLIRIPEEGGVPELVTRLNIDKEERTHRWPHLLPGGEAVLFTVGTTDSPDFYDNATIEATIIATGERRTLIDGAKFARYADPGYLIFARSRSLFAVPFDAKSVKVLGTPVPVLEGVLGDPTTGASHFSLSSSGSLAYIPGDARGAAMRLAWMDTQGSLETLNVPLGNYLDPSLSPDGSRLAVILTEGQDSDVWIYDFRRGTLSRFTFGGGNRSPFWSNDGRRVGYATLGAGTGKTKLYWKAADGGGEAEEIVELDGRVYPEDLSSDGKRLAVMEIIGNRESDLRILDLENVTESQPPFPQTDFDEFNAQFSPRDRWIAYVSSESGRNEVYVRAYPGPGGKWQISTDGGDEVRWSSDGRKLFYRFGSRLMEVPVETEPSFAAGTPRLLSDAAYNLRIETTRTFQPSVDGRRFLTIQPAFGSDQTGQINVVLNWVEGRRRVPTGGN